MSERPCWWQWPTVLSLDAPAVVLLWQWLLARAAGAALRPVHVLVLGISVWLAYAADRWIEGVRLGPVQAITQRHRFYQRHRSLIAFVWIAALAADLAAAFLSLSRRELTPGFALLIPVCGYLLLHQHFHRTSLWRIPKEVCVALLLGAGVALFITLSPAADMGTLAAPLALFVLLCFANCALISIWEQTVDRSHGQVSIAVQFCRGAVFSRALAWVLSAAGVLLAFASSGSERTAGYCAAASSLLLVAVDRIEPRAGWCMARVLADFALATPAIPLVARLLRG